MKQPSSPRSQQQYHSHAFDSSCTTNHPSSSSSSSTPSPPPPSPVFRLMGYGMALMFALCSVHVSRQMLVVMDPDGSFTSEAKGGRTTAAAVSSNYLEYGLRRTTTTTVLDSAATSLNNLNGNTAAANSENSMHLQQQQSHTTTINSPTHTHQQHSAVNSEIVWLMSFPNSGTSYTMNNVRRTSNMTTATNYANEAMQTAGRLVPVQHNLPDGPFLLLPQMQIPKYSLTKTHCTADCDACQIRDPVRALDQFDEGCRITTKGVWPDLTKISQRYKPAKGKSCACLMFVF
jgi:hypothetical protein